MNRSIIIAIDGHSSTGKSTMARELASKLNFVYIDTGAMYRAVALYAVRHNAFKSGSLDAEWLSEQLGQLEIDFRFPPEGGEKAHTFLNNEDIENEIRKMEVSNKVSEVAAVSAVRKFLVAQQQRMGSAGGIVMDGRDIGTVVFPGADLKIFMTASPEIRAQRRYQELREKGDSVRLDEVRSNLERRDHIDSNRSDSPLKQADDSKVLDNSSLNREEQLDLAMSWAHEAMGN